MAGSLAFVKFVLSLKVTTFYISRRKRFQTKILTYSEKAAKTGGAFFFNLIKWLVISEQKTLHGNKVKFVRLVLTGFYQTFQTLMVITPGIQKLWEVSHFLQNRERYFRVFHRSEDLLIFWNFFWLPSRTLSRPPCTYKNSTKTNTKRMKEVEQVENTNADIKEHSSYSISSSCNTENSTLKIDPAFLDGLGTFLFTADASNKFLLFQNNFKRNYIYPRTVKKRIHHWLFQRESSHRWWNCFYCWRG